MKKIIAALLCAAVCFATGCSKNESSSGSQLPTNTSSSAANQTGQSSVKPTTSGTTSQQSSKQSTTSSSKTSSKTSEPTSEPVTTSEYRRGKWSGSKYASDFFGFEVTVDDSWSCETDAQLVSRNSISDMNDATISKALDANKSPYELFATKTGGYSMAIGINKVKGVTASQYIKANVDQMKAMTTTFKDVSADKITVSGKEQDCIYATYASGIADVYEALVLYQNGEYYALITLGAMSPESLQSTIASVFNGTSAPSGDTSKPSANNGDYRPGRLNGNKFTSDFFGFSFTVDSSWTKGTDDELAILNSIDDMSDATVKAAVDKSDKDTMVYEAFILNNNDDNTIMVATNKDTAKTTDEYAQTQVNGMKLMSGYKDVRVDKANIAGKNQTCIYATISENGSEVYEMFVIYQNGNYFSVVVVAASSQGEPQNIINTIFA